MIACNTFIVGGATSPYLSDFYRSFVVVPLYAMSIRFLSAYHEKKNCKCSGYIPAFFVCVFNHVFYRFVGNND